MDDFGVDFGSISVSTAAADLAKGLSAIFQVSRGSLKSIEIRGGCDLAFLGTISYWLLDLNTSVHMHDGSVLFTSCLPPEEAVIKLRYMDMEQIESPIVHVSATTFVLTSVEDIIEDSYMPAIYRLRWDSCLSGLFYEESKDIMEQAYWLGKALGTIARIYQALAKCEADVAGLSRTHFINLQHRGYGKPFIDSVCSLLPELGVSGDFREGANDSLSRSVAENASAIQVLLAKLEDGCSCITCKPQVPSKRLHSCNMVVLMFLRYLGDIMAHVDHHSSILPTQKGLSSAYITQNRLKGHLRGAKLADHGSCLSFIMGLPLADSSLTNMKDLYPPSGQFALDYILDGVCRLFVGQEYHSKFVKSSRSEDEPQCTAMSRNGVCIWLDALRSANADPGCMSTVHVTAGQIMHRNTNYTSVWDLSHASAELDGGMPAAEFCMHGTPKNPSQSLNGVPELHALATERKIGGTIGFAYQVKNQNHRRYLQSGILTEELLVSSVRFPCSKSSTCSDELSMPHHIHRAGWDFMKYVHDSKTREISFKEDAAFFTWSTFGPVSRLLAIEGCRINSWYRNGDSRASSLIITRSDQCLGCLSRYWQTSKTLLMAEQSAYMTLKKYGHKGASLPCIVHII